MSALALLNISRFDVDSGGLSYAGYTLAQLQASAAAPADILQGVKDFLEDKVDADAEALREYVLTPGSGQAMEYQEVQAQAFAALATPATTTAAAYPMLAATVGLDIDPTTNAPAIDVLGVARCVIAAFNSWSTLGAAIRGVRLKGKAAIEATKDIPSAAAAYDAIVWPNVDD